MDKIIILANNINLVLTNQPTSSNECVADFTSIRSGWNPLSRWYPVSLLSDTSDPSERILIKVSLGDYPKLDEVVVRNQSGSKITMTSDSIDISNISIDSGTCIEIIRIHELRLDDVPDDVIDQIWSYK